MKLDRNLMELRDLYRGEDAFLVCGSPNFDLYTLSDEITFVTNNLYKHPSLINKLNFLVIGDLRFSNISPNELPTIRVKDGILTSKYVYENIFKHPKQYFYVGGGPKVFHKTMITRIWDGNSASFLSMQLAYFLGVRRLFVIGMDKVKESYNFKLARDSYEEDGRILEDVSCI